MKRFLALLLALVMAFPMQGYASDPKSAEGEFNYETNEDGNSVKITGYRGDGGDVIIPSEIDGKKVTAIGGEVFDGRSDLTSVSIPDGVTHIWSTAFSKCSGLTSVNLPDSLTYIGDNAFYGCSGLTSVNIPDSVTKIEFNAFARCSGLTSVNIPDSLMSVPDSIFADCSSLTSVSIPNSVRGIGDNSFAGCSGLTSITIPSSVGSIGWGAFAGCSGLTSITIPSSVTRIFQRAFFNCSGLKSITIPSSVISIESEAFGFIKKDSSNEKIPNFIIYGTSGSAAEDYAKFYDFTFKAPNKTDISKATITLSQTSYTYDGKAKTPTVTVKLDGKTLALNTDYTVTYSNNVNIGTAKATVTGIDNYTGRETAEFAITKAAEEPKKIDISKATVTLSQTSYTYDGKAKTPTVTVKLDGKTLVLNTDYTVAYSNNVNVGTAKVTVTGIGNYTGSKTAEFTITKAAEEPEKIDISKATVTLSQTSYTYDGKAKTPTVTVKLDGKTLALNTDYTVSYSNNTKAGTAKATVTGIGSYTF